MKWLIWVCTNIVAPMSFFMMLALDAGPALTQQADMSQAPNDQPGKCSVAKDEVIKIASWNIKNKSYRAREDADAFDDFVAMVRKIDADILALQEVTPGADEVRELVSALQSSGRCYSALISEETNGEKYGLLYDANVVDLFYPTGPAQACELGQPASVQDNSPLMVRAATSSADGRAAHLSYFRVKGDRPDADSLFDFAVINAHVTQGSSGLDILVQDFASLDKNYPWLVEERDRILVGDLGISANPGELRGNYFPQMKPLINPLLMINLGLSDMSFDDAIARMRPRGNASVEDGPPQHFDNILVHRWDRPGTCDRALYCGGLEEFIHARVYRYDKALIDPTPAFEETVSDHKPVAARFCKFADTDPYVDAVP